MFEITLIAMGKLKEKFYLSAAQEYAKRLSGYCRFTLLELACFLVEEFRRTDSEEICMTQEQIAQNVNSAREVVARMLRRFAAEGLIENSRGMILLKDIPSLERLGGSILQMEEFTKCSQ